MTQTHHLGCSLATLSQPYLAGALPGLDLSGPLLAVDPKYFPCCSGTGMQFDERTNCARSCRIRQRTAKLQALWDRYSTLWPESSDFPNISPSNQAKMLNWLASYARRKTARGFCIRRHSSSVPSQLWTLAAMAIWRFDMGVLWVSLGRDSLHEVLKRLEKLPSHSVCLVEQHFRVWEHADALEAIVGWCENAQFPLWLDFVAEGRPLSRVDSRRLNHFQRSKFKEFSAELQEVAHRDPLSWVDDYCRSRIQSVCHPLNSDMNI